MAQRDAPLQAARDDCIGDHAREHVVRLEMLIEVEIDAQPGPLRQIEQRRERARRIGAGIEAGADQIGAHRDGALEALDRPRFDQIVLRGRERDDIDVEPLAHALLRRQHAFHRLQLDDRIDVGVGPHPRDPVLDRPFEQPRGARGYIGGGEARPRRGRRGNGVGERARPERLHRIGAIGMSMEVDEARKRQPGGLTGLFGRTNGRDRSFAQRHREHTGVPRQRDGLYRDFIRYHQLRDYLLPVYVSQTLSQYPCGPNTSIPNRRSSARPKRYFISGPS